MAKEEVSEPEFTGGIVEESLKDNRILNDMEVLEIEMSESDSTYHVYTVALPKEEIKKLQHQIKPGPYYANFSNDETDIIVFPDKVFEYKADDTAAKQEAIEYGKSLGIPQEELDF